MEEDLKSQLLRDMILSVIASGTVCSGTVGVGRASTSRAGRTGLSFGWRFAYWIILGSIFLLSPTPLYHSQDLLVDAGQA